MSALLPRWPEFPQIKGIVNTVTGETVPVGLEIHRDDLDWLAESWQHIYLLGWELTAAERKAPSARVA